ncbi:MAG TPA: butyrate kinase [Anaerolineae bacterium]|nr:butyrate kinase [Anaerolineae bacterium]
MHSGFKILTINPGSTSTKIGLFRDEEALFIEELRHAAADLAIYSSVSEQHPMRRDAVLATLSGHGLGINELDAVVGRGGILKPIPGGTYLVGEQMLADLRSQRERDHASNLGALLAHEIAEPLGLPAYIVDPVCVDEFDRLARVSGLPEIERRSLSHALNIKATARRAAADMGWRYGDLMLVVVHMGGGITVSAHRRGRMIDVNQALDGTGPFSPERAGGLPVGDVLRMAYSVPPYDEDQRSYADMFQRVAGQGGLVAHLGTNDAEQVERRIAAGDAHAQLVYEAMAYQIAKEIGGMVTVLRGDVDAIVLTGGLAHSTMLVGWIEERLRRLAPVLIYPGQDEMLAMAEGALRVLRGLEPARVYS